MHNARLADRAPFSGQVDLVPHKTANVLRVWGHDVSETGMFLQTTQPFLVGDTVSLRFDVDDNEVHVRAAEVVWVRPFEPVSVDGKLPGIGLRFVSVDPPARAALRRLAKPKSASSTDALPPPKVTLPPLTESIIARAQGIEPRGKRAPSKSTLPFISLAPFSQLPSISLPPEDDQLSSEARVFDGVPRAPRDVTMAPQQVRGRITDPMLPAAAFADLYG
jgi:uncharacterized protein (TIGR02266 family)